MSVNIPQQWYCTDYKMPIPLHPKLITIKNERYMALKRISIPEDWSITIVGLLFKPIGKMAKSFQTVWFTLSFLCIGLETNFRTFFTNENRKATLVFLGAQTFNVVFTLLIATLIFGFIGHHL